MNLVYKDPYFFAIDKPEGVFVHPPEASPYPVPREKIALFRLQALFGCSVYPVHRLDAATSGLVLFAFSKSATRELSALFASREIKKTYAAVARGFVDEVGKIDLPLEIKGFETPIDATTHYRRLRTIELPYAIGKRHPTARYSLVEVNPHTGRWHQIRRHFDRIAHPLLGDIEHGDSHHNRFFRDTIGIKGLCLRAKSLEFVHPWTREQVRINADTNQKWRRIECLFDDQTPGPDIDTRIDPLCNEACRSSKDI